MGFGRRQVDTEVIANKQAPHPVERHHSDEFVDVHAAVTQHGCDRVGVRNAGFERGVDGRAFRGPLHGPMMLRPGLLDELVAHPQGEMGRQDATGVRR